MFTRTQWLLSMVLVVVLVGGNVKAFALGTETKGNKPLSESNYTEWKGIMPLVNDKARVYQNWVNGNERLFYRGTTKELSAALARFAEVEVKNHVVVLRPGPVVQHTFDKTKVPYDWELHVIGGIARSRANDDLEDLEWHKDPVLTIYVGGDIHLDKIAIPKGVTWRSAPGKSEEARNNTTARQRIEEFLELRR